MSDALTELDLERLRAIDTPTLCNALEEIDPAWRLAGFTTRPFVCHDPDLAPIVGLARTATIRAGVPPQGGPAEQRAARLDYYAYVADGPLPRAIVIRDEDPEPGLGAFWGEVNTHVHRGLGCQGVVTNGSMRDWSACAHGFQLLAGSVGPSHAWAHVTSFGLPVEVHGLVVAHDDLIHADRHGAVIVPRTALPRIAEVVDRQARREKVILDAAKRLDFSIDTLRRAMTDAADIH
jgi:regulator of RNase E activity RraA